MEKGGGGGGSSGETCAVAMGIKMKEVLPGISTPRAPLVLAMRLLLSPLLLVFLLNFSF